MSGIYKMTNTVNNKVYIGKSRNMHQRFIDYVGDIRKGKKRFILDAIRKYGWEAFRLEIIELYPTREIPNDYLLDREAFWIKIYQAAKRGIGYNLCEYSRDRGGIPLTEEHKKKIGAANAGRKTIVSDEWRRICSEAQFKRRGTKFSTEHKNKISLGRKDRLLAEKLDPDTGEILSSYQSINAAEKAMMVNVGKIHYAIKTNKVVCGFRWRASKVTNC